MTCSPERRTRYAQGNVQPPTRGAQGALWYGSTSIARARTILFLVETPKAVLDRLTHGSLQSRELKRRAALRGVKLFDVRDTTGGVHRLHAGPEVGAREWIAGAHAACTVFLTGSARSIWLSNGLATNSSRLLISIAAIFWTRFGLARMASLLTSLIVRTRS